MGRSPWKGLLEPDRPADRAITAHEEHTIMVADGGPVVLTAPRA